MASATKSFVRIAARSSIPLNATFARTSTQLIPRHIARSSRRGYASDGSSSSMSSYYWAAGALAAAGAGGYFYYNNGGFTNLKEGSAKETPGMFTPSKDDYQKVYNTIAKLLGEKDNYDDGSYGPVLVRLAWHCSGTYDKETGTGGSNGATMRFAPEGDHGANAGLKAARDFLDPVKRKQFC